MIELLIAFAALTLSGMAWREAKKLRGDVFLLRRAVVGLQEHVMELSQRPTPPLQESPPPEPSAEAVARPEPAEPKPAPTPAPEPEIAPPVAPPAPARHPVDLEQ